MTIRNDKRKQSKESHPRRVVKEEERSIRRCRKEEQQFRTKRYSIEERKIFKKKMALFDIRQWEQQARNYMIVHESYSTIAGNNYLPSLKDQTDTNMLPIVYALFHECVSEYVKALVEKAALLAEEWTESNSGASGIMLKETDIDWARTLLEDERTATWKRRDLGLNKNLWLPFSTYEQDIDPISESDTDMISEEEVEMADANLSETPALSPHEDGS
jgi:hypothetical protein